MRDDYSNGDSSYRESTRATISHRIFSSVEGDVTTVDYKEQWDAIASARLIDLDVEPYLQLLPELDAEIIYLLHEKKKNQKEISEILGLSQSTASYRLRRAMEKLEYLVILSSVPYAKIVSGMTFLREKEREVLVDLLRCANQDLVSKNNGVRQAVALDTPILTKIGWKTMESIEEGDEVRHPSGSWTRVVAKSEILARDTYEVRFLGTGETIRTDGTHLWKVWARRLPPELAVKVTGGRQFVQDRWEKELIAGTVELLPHATLGGSQDLANFRIPLTAPFEGEDKQLPLSPYALGLWLGDGITAAPYLCIYEEELVELAKEALPDLEPMKWAGRYRSDNLRDGLRGMGFAQGWGVSEEKHIPRDYLEAGIKQRQQLLAGLIDTDAHVKNGRVEYTTTVERLAFDVWELVLGLGFMASKREFKATVNGKDCGPGWRIDFTADGLAGSLLRKGTERAVSRGRYWRIKGIQKVNPVETQCLQVAADDGMYLVGRSLIPTHNSSVKWIFTKALRRIQVLERSHPEQWRPQASILFLLERNLRMRVR